MKTIKIMKQAIDAYEIGSYVDAIKLDPDILLIYSKEKDTFVYIIDEKDFILDIDKFFNKFDRNTREEKLHTDISIFNDDDLIDLYYVSDSYGCNKSIFSILVFDKEFYVTIPKSILSNFSEGYKLKGKINIDRGFIDIHVFENDKRVSIMIMKI